MGSIRKGSYLLKLFELYQHISENEFMFYEILTMDFPLYNADLEELKPEIMISKMYDKFDEQYNLAAEQTKEFLKSHVQSLFEFIQ